MSKFLDSRFNKISYLTPLSFFILYHPKNSLFWGRIEGRFRRVASYVLVSKNACPLRGISDGPDGPKFDVRARGFPPRAPSASPAGRGAAPSGARFAPLRVVIPPAAGLGRAVSASRVRFARPRNPRHARPAGCAWLRVARAALDPAPSLKTRLRASQSLVDTFKRPSGATGHRIALGGPLRPPDGHSGPAWSSPAPQAWFRGSAPAPQPVRL